MRYAAEVYAPGATDADVATMAQQAAAAAEAVSSTGVRVRHVRSILMPRDEVCIHLFVAPSRAAVEEVGRKAGVRFESVTEAATAP